MRKPVRLISTAAAMAALAGSLALAAPSAASAATPSAADIQQGKALAFSRKEGNCLACHMIPGGQMAGTIAPPLIAMKARYPDRQKLFDQIWDARRTVPTTLMPPFGAHLILNKSQINKIIDFLYTH
jgi:L-cysteine S-thiosulfotransferase